LFFFFRARKKKIFFYSRESLSFKKTSSSLSCKVSFNFLFLLRKQLFCKSLNFDFFFFNNLCLLFFKKVVEIIYLYKRDLFFFNSQGLGFSSLDELNYVTSKKNYLFARFLQKMDYALTLNNFNHKLFKFVFLDKSSMRRNLRYLVNRGDLCGLLHPEMSPRLCFFFLPIFLNETFSLFFYKFFFYSLLAEIAF